MNAERAVTYGKAEIPGGKTGLVVTEFKTIRVTDDKGNDVLKLVPEHVVDTGLMKEMRENLKQAAQELGQWTEKSEFSTTDPPKPALPAWLMDQLKPPGDTNPSPVSDDSTQT